MYLYINTALEFYKNGYYLEEWTCSVNIDRKKSTVRRRKDPLVFGYWTCLAVKTKGSENSMSLQNLKIVITVELRIGKVFKVPFVSLTDSARPSVWNVRRPVGGSLVEQLKNGRF